MQTMICTDRQLGRVLGRRGHRVWALMRDSADHVPFPGPRGAALVVGPEGQSLN